jgi:hypothetical protein
VVPEERKEDVKGTIFSDNVSIIAAKMPGK